MRRFSHSLIASVMAVALAGASFNMVLAQHHRTKKSESAKHKRLKSKLSAIEAKKAVIAHQLHRTQVKAHQVKRDIYSVDNQIETARNELDDTTTELANDQARQAELSRELVIAQKRLGETKVTAEKRLRELYMEGDAPLASVLLGMRSSSDFASKAYLVQRIARSDRKTFEEYASAREEVASKKQEQDSLVSQVAGLVEQKKAQETSLKQARSEKVDILEGLQEKGSELEKALEQFAQDEAQIQSQIAASESQSEPGVPTHFSGRFMLPLHGTITSGFGERYHPILHRVRRHDGVDIAAPTGTPIHSAAAGTVIAAQYMNGYGNVVIVDHGGGYSTVYGHCSRILCHVGEQVTQGQVIARVGMTGLATGPHCHFEIRVHSHPVNPLSLAH